jgi:hypothetical protein
MRREKRPRAATKKELIMESGDYCKGFVEVGPHDTLADVRVLIHEDFDDDMLPTCATFSSMMNAGDDVAIDTARDAFYFLLAGVQLSRKQERRQRAWDWVGQTVRILATLPQPAAAEHPALPPPPPEDEDLPAAKKQRLRAPTSISTLDPVTATASVPSAAASRAPHRSWKQAEDAKLTKAVKKYGKNWVAVAAMAPGRTRVQCRQRWVDTLDPTNGKKGQWSTEDDAKLTEAVQKHGKKWVAVAVMVPDRTDVQCRNRWITVNRANGKKGQWSPEEDATLTEAVKKHGQKWAAVAVMVPGRTDKQCRRRWVNILDPAYGKKLGKWTQAEDRKMTKAMKKHGKKWVAVAAMVPGRTNIQCRLRVYNQDRTSYTRSA